MTAKKVDAKEYVAIMNASAERLYEVRNQLRTREETFKAETNDLYEEEKQLRADLLLGLKTIGLSSIKTAAGESYSITRTNDFIVKNPMKMEEFARDQRCVSIDKRLLKQRFTKAFKEGNLPDWVEAEERETISIRGAKKEEEAAEDTG